MARALNMSTGFHDYANHEQKCKGARAEENLPNSQSDQEYR